jgi:hypothetical protein
MDGCAKAAPINGGAYPARGGVRILVEPVATNDDPVEAIWRVRVNPAAARRIARTNLGGQYTRFGESVLEHVGRVAAAVPTEARAVAWLHDLFELVPFSWSELWARGLTAAEASALALLTHGENESYKAYVLRIADAQGQAGEIARVVKLADLDDHLAHTHIPADAPPYRWARQCVLAQADTRALSAASA